LLDGWETEENGVRTNPKYSFVNLKPLVPVSGINTKRCQLIRYEKGALWVKWIDKKARQITENELDNALWSLRNEKEAATK
jgi:hypothetical protein